MTNYADIGKAALSLRPAETTKVADIRALCAGAVVAIGSENITVAELNDFIGDDARNIVDGPNADGVVEAAGRLLLTVKAKAAGKMPDGWTEAASCAKCGPVWLWPEAERTGAALACPWCENRLAGFVKNDDGFLIEERPIPRPDKVRCCDCQHWTADVIGDGGGIGPCELNGPVWNDRPAFPNVRRWCSAFLALR